MGLRFKKVPKGTIFIVVLLVTVVGIYWVIKSSEVSLPKKRGQEGRKELALIWQKKFDGEVYGVSIFIWPNGRDPKEIPVMQVRTNKALHLIDEKGRSIRKFRPFGDSLQVSRDGKYILEQIAETQEKGIDQFTTTIRYTTQDGECLWERKNVFGARISPAGDVLVRKGVERNIQFFDKNAKLIKGYNIEYKYGSTNHTFSENGDFYVLTYSQWHEKDEKLKNYILVLDKRRDLICNKEIGIREPDWIAISSNGKIYMIANFYLYCLNVNGKGIWQKKLTENLKEEYPYVQKTILLLDENVLVVPYKGFIAFLNSSSGKEIRRVKSESLKKGYILGCSSLGTIGVITTAIDTSRKFYLISNEGKIIYTKDFPILDTVEGAGFSENGKFLYFVVRKDVFIFVYNLEI